MSKKRIPVVVHNGVRITVVKSEKGFNATFWPDDIEESVVADTVQGCIDKAKNVIDNYDEYMSSKST